ncbi:MAG TPA: hypothetical protein VG963_04855, partial [Polyangiaceae bacterium]|nr:hypothetical protein [Polyangiaceae bacterium]
MSRLANQPGGAQDATPRFYGKYRGVCVDNIDPLELGRIFVKVASVPGVIASPALPCVPYAGLQVG